MQFRRSDLADLTYFLEIAKHRNFRRAALELGISASALSHALRGLEERVGVRLLNRTSRSVTLTAAGEELQAAISEPLDAIGRAVDVLNRFRDTPIGRIRLSVPTEAAELLVGPVLATFVERYPDVALEISVSNRIIDVIDGGFDGGIRYGGTVPEDMIAQRLSADIRWVVVASPAYLERFGRPAHPDDLQAHRCVRIRTGDDRIYRWELERRRPAARGRRSRIADRRSGAGRPRRGQGRRRPDVRAGAPGRPARSAGRVADRPGGMGVSRPRVSPLLLQPSPRSARAHVLHRGRTGAAAARLVRRAPRVGRDR